jgi:hypothetical protein
LPHDSYIVFSEALIHFILQILCFTDYDIKLENRIFQSRRIGNCLQSFNKK